MADSGGQHPKPPTPPASPSAASGAPAAQPVTVAAGFSTVRGAEPLTSSSMTNVDFKTDTPKKQKRCNCRNSHCLKLYCECFAAGLYCNGCNCSNCSNNVENEEKRRNAIDNTLHRNPDAFKPKIKSAPVASNSRTDVDGKLPVVPKHHKGCHCKKSGCLKKYCECFEMQVLCSRNCKCIGCKNYEGSEDRQGLLQGDNGFHSSNGALNGSIGSSPLKKRKRPDDFPGQLVDAFGRVSPLPARYLSSTGLASSYGNIGSDINYPHMRPSKLRCPLAEIIRPEHVRDLCTLLVTECREAAKEFYARAENKAEELKLEEMDKNGNGSSDSILRDKANEAQGSQDMQDMQVDLPSKANLEKSNLDGQQSERADAQSVSRPVSPTTLALMCDEEDSMFAEPSRASSLPPRLNDQGRGINMELYAEQERRVLILFRDTLCRLSTAARIREAQSSLAAMQPESRLKDEATTSAPVAADLRPQNVDVNSSNLSSSHTSLSVPLEKQAATKDQT